MFHALVRASKYISTPLQGVCLILELNFCRRVPEFLIPPCFIFLLMLARREIIRKPDIIIISVLETGSFDCIEFAPMVLFGETSLCNSISPGEALPSVFSLLAYPTTEITVIRTNMMIGNFFICNS